jgi:hypothetical protein
MSELLQRFIEVRLAEHNAVVERACEKALQSGHQGVVVVDDDGVTRARPTYNVPFGHMATFPSYDAYYRWIQNGCPL